MTRAPKRKLKKEIFGEATAISRLHLLTTSRENRKNIKIDFWEATAISRLHLLRTPGENRKNNENRFPQSGSLKKEVFFGTNS